MAGKGDSPSSTFFVSSDVSWAIFAPGFNSPGLFLFASGCRARFHPPWQRPSNERVGLGLLFNPPAAEKQVSGVCNYPDRYQDFTKFYGSSPG